MQFQTWKNFPIFCAMRRTTGKNRFKKPIWKTRTSILKFSPIFNYITQTINYSSHMFCMDLCTFKKWILYSDMTTPYYFLCWPQSNTFQNPIHLNEISKPTQILDRREKSLTSRPNKSLSYKNKHPLQTVEVLDTIKIFHDA